MGSDNITEAFSRWKAAHESFLATEQRLFNSARADTFGASEKLDKSNPLLLEVQVKRAHAENLLLAAMKLLHESRHGGADASTAAHKESTPCSDPHGRESYKST